MNEQDIQKALGEYANYVTIEAKTSKFIIKMKKKEAKDIWEEINHTIKEFGGKWIYGVGSHGEIPFTAGPPEQGPTVVHKVAEAEQGKWSDEERAMQWQKGLALVEDAFRSIQESEKLLRDAVTQLKEALK